MSTCLIFRKVLVRVVLEKSAGSILLVVLITEALIHIFLSYLSKCATSNNFLFSLPGEWTLRPFVILRWFLVDKDKCEIGDTSKISIYICVNEA